MRCSMSRNTSVTLGDHLAEFVNNKIDSGRFESTSEAVRAGLRLLEEQETKMDILRETLATGELQLDQGKGIDGEDFMNEMLS